MAHDIFISYRRADTRHTARALYERLKQEFGADAVFFDVSSIDLGQNFPQALADGIQRAQVVLAVAGSTWQKTLLANARRRKSTDYVREELRLAGQRLARGEALLLVPVLLDGGQGFDPDGWTPALKQDLAALTKANGVSFADGSWEADFQRLLKAIKAWRASLPALGKGLDDERAAVLGAVLKLLQQPGLQGLAAHWCPDDAAVKQAASKQLRDLRRGLKIWRESGTAPTGIAAVRPRCMALVAALARLAVNAEAARQALAGQQALACAFKGVAALVRAVAQGHPLVLLPVSKGFDVRPDRVAEANVELDPGAGLWVKDLALQFWNAMYPADMRQDFSANEIKALAALLRDRTEDDGAPFMVLCPAQWGKIELARSRSQELNAVPVVWAEPAAGSASLLYEDEHDLVASIKACIDEIGQL